MSVPAATFRQDFPEFADTDRFPAAVVQFWLDIAASTVASPRWGDILEKAQELWAAHNIVLQRQAMDQVAAGGLPGSMRGVVNSESVDKASVGYDVGVATIEKAGDLNLTSYGVRYARLSDIYGAGPIQVTGCGTLDPLSSAFAWGGFPTYNSPTPDG